MDGDVIKILKPQSIKYLFGACKIGNIDIIKLFN